MESWSYVSKGKGFVSNSESTSPPDSLSRINNRNWEFLKTPYSWNHIPGSGVQQPSDTGQGCFGMEVGLQQLVAKQLPSTSNSGVQTDRFGVGSDMNHMNGIMSSSLNAFSEEEDSTSKFSSSVVESNSRDSPVIDLKLGRFNDKMDQYSSRFPYRGSVLSSSESIAPSKRARSGGVSSQVAYCQVYGCSKDLSSSKDYHKRHKVCEAHSKTTKVIVNGIEQRFCQQCSRFHLLGEFDDGKRSCRKRLAGHNERRRKPQVGAHASRSGRLLQSFNGFGSKFQGNAFAPYSFTCQDILSTGTLLDPEKYGSRDIYGRIKLEERTDNSVPFTAIALLNGQISNFEKHFPFGVQNGLSSSNSSGILGGQTSAVRSFYQDSHLGAEDFSSFNSASTLQGFSGISEPGCALSLLSSPSQNSPSYSQVSTKLIPTSLVMSSGEGSQTSPVLISGCDDSVNYERILHGQQEVLHGKGDVSCDGGAAPTISLSQLSSQLQRVEHQRQLVKWENDPFMCARIT